MTTSLLIYFSAVALAIISSIQSPPFAFYSGMLQLLNFLPERLYLLVEGTTVDAGFAQGRWGLRRAFVNRHEKIIF